MCPCYVANVRLLEQRLAVTDTRQDPAAAVCSFESISDVIWIALPVHDIRTKHQSTQGTIPPFENKNNNPYMKHQLYQ